jgi:hypothetical protein
MTNGGRFQTLGAKISAWYRTHWRIFWVFVAFFVLTTIYHGFYKFLFADDLSSYLKMVDDYGMNGFALASDEYATWSSRYLYNLVGRYLVFAPALFLVLDILVDLVTLYLFYDLLGKKSPGLLLALACFFLLVPIEFYWEAGWIITAVNYSWPLCAALFVLRSLKKAKLVEPLGSGDYVLAVLGMLYAFWSELLSALFFVLGLALLVYFLTKKKLSPLALVTALLALGGVLNALLCPGNALRVASESTDYFPGFLQLTFGGKLVEGFAFLSQNLLAYPLLNNRFYFNNTFLYDLFLALLLVVALLSHKKWYVVLLSCLPLVGSFLLQEVISGVSDASPFAFLYDLDSALPYDDPVLWVFLTLSLLIFLTVFAEIVLIFGTKDKLTYLLLGLFFAGCALKGVLGFSPTVYASRYRTDFPLYFAFVLALGLLYQRAAALQPKSRLPLLLAFVLCALVSYVFSFKNWEKVYNPTDYLTFQLF